jgi:hypothetical protein
MLKEVIESHLNLLCSEVMMMTYPSDPGYLALGLARGECKCGYRES